MGFREVVCSIKGHKNYDWWENHQGGYYFDRYKICSRCFRREKERIHIDVKGRRYKRDDSGNKIYDREYLD